METYEQFNIEITTFAFDDTVKKDIISSSSSEKVEHDNSFIDFGDLE